MSNFRKTRSSIRKHAQEESSSSESEYSKTLTIINKLSQKYLGPTKKKEKRKGKEKSPDVAYEGDVENSSDTNSSSSQKSSLSAFDFDEEDPIQLKMELSPAKNVKSVKQRSLKKTVAKKSKPDALQTLKTDSVNTNNGNSKGKKASNRTGKKVVQSNIPSVSPILPCEQPVLESSQHGKKGKKRNLKSVNDKDVKNVSFSPIVSEMTELNLNRSPLLSIDKMDQRGNRPLVKVQKLDLSMSLIDTSTETQTRKRKCDTQSVCISPSKALKVNPNIIHAAKTHNVKLKVHQKRKDSGIFTSKDTSTPKDSRCNKVEIRDDSTFGFCNIPSPMDVSPVKKVSEMTPLSDYASMNSSMLSHSDVSKFQSNQNIELFMEAEDEEAEISFNKSIQKAYKPKKKNQKKSKAKEPSRKEGDWMEKMNSEFSDIERFELSIEG